MLRRDFLALFALAKPADRARELAAVYGQQLTEVVYIQSFALLGRLRLGALEQVEAMVQPFLGSSLEKATASHLSGHLLFADLAKRTGKELYRERVQAAAELAQLPLYNEMSDGVFMGCPILSHAGRIDEAVFQFHALKKLCERSDGLWRHSPLCEAAWGRGNAFAVLGLALALEAQPAPSALRPAFTKLCATLVRWQTPHGLWRQVIDHPNAYEEFSATAMIGAAFQKGIANGWLPARGYRRSVEKAWAAISARSNRRGELQGVCESTGKQPTLAAYLNRKAINGIDPRGGAMALYFATEPGTSNGMLRVPSRKP
ncbi:glycoside hydrolase family 88 protein [Bryobacter aggregatus]|uniref:glycoside hydrolase family 88 protein n=1 Tax=Bryobacter aggregatus TaxID=360054 RepID=UPI0004E0BD7E|nr:glycoside hydrolase family 88 protein [Bryobacter aggregatus]